MHIGILGGGQLGRMLALAGHPLGMQFRVLEPAAECPAAPVADHDRGEFEDYQALFTFCQGLDVITYEFENVPVESARWLAERVPVYPTPRALEIGQDRIAEKAFFQDLVISVPAFASVNSRADLEAAVGRIGLPAVLKTTRFGYDGKGQAVIQTRADMDSIWATLGGRPLILEGFVPFDRELSILAVRGRAGELAFYPLVENIHRNGILRVSTGPANGVSRELQAEAEAIATKVLESLDYVGVLAVELFQVGEDLLVNEMAPRVHNSGHWTIEGAETSQFENHLRAVAGLPLGSTAPVGRSAMINLIGGWPEPAAVLAVPGAHLHLYAKKPRPNRKVGHITVRADSERDFVERVRQVRALLER
ncbi:MAG: 5-(carboxyamino)imidazole ribonucleotide synthase [Zavarzinella sp.]|nr:5-(carboxyamino)imidazole ribonucleotide synthase [Zavarzinella sp.]